MQKTNVRNKKRKNKPQRAEVVYLHCPGCNCIAGDDGQDVVDGALVSCPCSCHSTHTASTATYRGTRIAQSRGRFAYTVVTQDDAPLKFRQDVYRDFVSRDWGPRSTHAARMRLAVDLVCDALGATAKDHSVYEIVADAFLEKLCVDDWKFNADELRRLIASVEKVAP